MFPQKGGTSELGKVNLYKSCDELTSISAIHNIHIWASTELLFQKLKVYATKLNASQNKLFLKVQEIHELVASPSQTITWPAFKPVTDYRRPERK